MWKIYVGNLSSRIRELELSNVFRPYGLVRSIWIARNPPGYGFVEFDSRQEAHDAIAALDGKHGWRVEMSRRSLGGIRSRSSNRDTRCRECGSRRHHDRDCRFKSSKSSRKSSSPHSPAHKSRDSAKRRRSRSRSPLRDDQLNERSPRNHVDSFPVKSEYSRSPQNDQNRSPGDHENSFAVKSECSRSRHNFQNPSPRDHEHSFAVKSESSRSPKNVQSRSPSARSATVSEDSPFREIGSRKSPQNDLIDPRTDGYHSSKECERSFSPRSGSGRSPDVQKGFESDVPAVSEPDSPDLSGLSEHMNHGNSPSPST